MDDFRRTDNDPFPRVLGEESLDDLESFVTELGKKRLLRKVTESPEYADWLRDLADLAIAESTSDLGVLRVMAILGKIDHSLGGRDKAVIEVLSGFLASAPPPVRILKDPAGRLYCARAVRHASGNWVATYAATSVVFEEQAEKARREFCEVLERNCDVLTEMFRLLREPALLLEFDTKNPGDTRSKRLNRILRTLGQTVTQSHLPAGDELPSAIESFTEAVLPKRYSPETREVAIEVAGELASLAHEIIRTHFALATDPSIYQVPIRAKGWFVGGWPEKLRPSLEPLVSDLKEAIELLALQERVSGGLFDCLAAYLGGREYAKNVTAEIAQTRNLPEEIRIWLMSGGKQQAKDQSKDVSENAWLEADRLVASMSVVADELLSLLDAQAKELKEEAEFLQPTVSAVLGRLLRLSEQLSGESRTLARKRSLKLIGEVGEVVQYFPLEHEPESGETITTETVRVIRSGVVRDVSGMSQTVVLKALVRPE